MEKASAKAKSSVILALDLEEDKPTRILSRSLQILEATYPYLCALKLNRQTVLPLGLFQGAKKIVDKAHDFGLPVIMDAKINDIGSTNRAIAEYYYEAGFDAVIASPFVGWEEGLQPVFETAHKLRKGVIVLVYMSHKGASEGYGQIVQNLKTGKLEPQYKIFAQKALEWEADGAVVGATYPEKIREIYKILGNKVPIYSPGVGAQGGDVAAAVKAGARYLIVGRTIVQAKEPAEAARGLRNKAQKKEIDIDYSKRVYSSRPLVHSSFFSMSLTDDLIAALRLGYMLALTSSSKPSK
jgi:orotidine-5'-phosphate decarboxylase